MSAQKTRRWPADPDRPLLVVDLEATCWERPEDAPGPPPGCRYPNEIIEIGAVLLDPREHRMVQEFQVFVRPRLHPRLTPFCTGLTSITQADVDAAEPFAAALARFAAAFGLRGDDGDPVFASWGRYDALQLEDDCRKHGLAYPFAGDNHLNLKAVLPRLLGIERRGLTALLERLGLPFEGTLHRGIDDARMIARAVATVLARGEAGRGC